ncbi:MAG TPA: hypothetical protein VGL95_07505 [Acetobacteraceae bacterium]|jgi:predicted small lipoprotein YifL
MRSVSTLLLVLATLAGAVTACTPANNADPGQQHVNAKPPPTAGASGGGY